jgi:hypothetical protein
VWEETKSWRLEGAMRDSLMLEYRHGSCHGAMAHLVVE